MKNKFMLVCFLAIFTLLVFITGTVDIAQADGTIYSILCPTNTPRATRTNIPTLTPKSTLTNTATSTPTNTSTQTSIATDIPTQTSTATDIPTQTSTTTPTKTPTIIITITETNTPIPTNTNTSTPTGTYIIPTSTATIDAFTPTATNTSIVIPTSTETVSTPASTSINTSTPIPMPTETVAPTSTPYPPKPSVAKSDVDYPGNLIETMYINSISYLIYGGVNALDGSLLLPSNIKAGALYNNQIWIHRAWNSGWFNLETGQIVIIILPNGRTTVYKVINSSYQPYGKYFNDGVFHIITCYGKEFWEGVEVFDLKIIWRERINNY